MQDQDGLQLLQSAGVWLLSLLYNVAELAAAKTECSDTPRFPSDQGCAMLSTMSILHF